MLTVTEYLANAVELETRAEGFEPGTSQDAYREMARQWRELAARANTVEAISSEPSSSEDQVPSRSPLHGLRLRRTTPSIPLR